MNRKQLEDLPLSERFKIDLTSPSCLTWLVPTRVTKVGDPAGSLNKQGYYTIGRAGKGHAGLTAHHVVFELTHGRPCRPGYEIDHKDRDPGNNHPDNLREVTRQQNGWNKVGNNTDWFPKGVDMKVSEGRIRARVTDLQGRRKVIGSFLDHADDSSEKLNALCAATLEVLQDLHGEHGCYDSYYCQLPMEAVLGPDEGWP